MQDFFKKIISLRVPSVLAIAAIALVGSFAAIALIDYTATIKWPVHISYFIPKMKQAEKSAKKIRPKPGPISMEAMKNQGCVADGILSGYGGDTEDAVYMIQRSNCRYLHRALETWLRAPDFDKAEKIMDDINRPKMIYGMFIAEALNKKSQLYYPDEDRQFDFNDMCGPDTKNDWGEHTCKPNFKKEEYRKYIDFIAREAMDLGIQSFEFGQVYYQDTEDDHKNMFRVMDNMRKYAKEIGIDIVIGAQTNDITDEKYLRKFDFIEGGVGIKSDGSIEDGPCFSRWYKNPGDYCWALLWHDNYARKAKNVFLHLDWSGIIGDDMSIYTRMDAKERAETLGKLHRYFTSRKMGFLMPMSAVLSKDNGGCHGNRKGFYSASVSYTCQDENFINDILAKKK